MAAEEAQFSTYIACIGAGYVGGPTMAMIASKCPHIKVTVLDISQAQIDRWNSDKLPIFEPGLDELVKGCRGRNLFFSTDIDKEINQAEIIFVCVNTPTKLFGIGAGAASNLTNLEKAARKIAEVSKTPKIVVEKSTVPVQTADAIAAVLHASNKAVSFQVLSNPEFLAEGTAVRDMAAPSRVLIGGAQTPPGLRAVAKLVEVYANWVPRNKIITTNLWSSELSKLVANAFLAQRISSINSISALCEKTNADVDEVARAIGSDPRIGPNFLRSSVGFGGSCFQKDILNLVYLCRSFHLEEVAEYWHQVVKMNDYQKNRFSKLMVKSMFNTVTAKKICVYGFAFKKNTGDTRETASAYIAKTLLQERAKVCVYDPEVTEEEMFREMKYTCGVDEDTQPQLKELMTMVGDPYEAAKGAHAIAVCTEWDVFKTLDYAKIYADMRKPAFIFDGRNILDHDGLRSQGFEVYAVGKPMVGKALRGVGSFADLSITQ